MFIRSKKKLPTLPSAEVILLCALTATYTGTSRAQPVRFGLPTNANGAASETVMIPLNLNPNNNAVGSFDATVEFNNTLLTYTGFTMGPILAPDNSWLVDVNGNNANGIITIGAFSFARVTGPGAAVLLKFVVSATATGGDTARLALRGLAATDTNAAPLPLEGTAGRFTVKPAISGRVRDVAETAINVVTLAGLPGNPTTDAQGYYYTTVQPGWTGTVTPTKRGYTFDPPSRQYDEATHDWTEQDYLGTEALAESFAFPNPFNPTAETAQIRFALKHPAEASIKILDGSGDVVREFTSAVPPFANAPQNLRWDGRNGRGELVDSGIYFYIIAAPANPRLTGKIGVVR